MRSLVLRLFLMAGLILPATALISAVPAGAAPLETCHLRETATVIPGLGSTAVAQKFKAVVTLTACTGPGGKTSGTAKGTLKSKNPSTANCATLSTNGSTAAGATTVTWNGGTHSKGTATVTVDRATHGVLSGKITNKNVTNPVFTGEDWRRGHVRTPERFLQRCKPGHQARGHRRQQRYPDDYLVTLFNGNESPAPSGGASLRLGTADRHLG